MRAGFAAVAPPPGPAAQWLLRTAGDRAPAGALADLVKDEARPGDGGRRLCCRVCGLPVTDTASRVSVAGSHRHVFTNPAGVVYEIGCFAAAPGCAGAGTPTADFTWFPGYRWSFALCADCGTHLGWRYAAGAGGFYGLILDRLVEESTEGGRS